MTFKLMIPGAATSGVYFDMAVSSVDYHFTNNIMVSAETSRAIGSPYAFRLSKHTYQGHAAPTIRIQGNIDTRFGDPTYQEGFPMINLGWLGSLARAAGSVAYGRDEYIERFIGSRTNTAPGAGSFSVIIQSVDLRSDTSKQDNGSRILWEYSMNLIETRV